MRSRYCAFALGLAEYLYDTLHSRHEDRATPKDKLIFALRDGARTQRFMGLTILEHVEEADHAEVLFLASVFEAGRDNSFVELSRFEREDGAYRYLSGALVHAATLADPKSLTREAFLKLKPRA
jgi:SEC-C motif-containing protein